jgi:hypothetical protein
VEGGSTLDQLRDFACRVVRPENRALMAKVLAGESLAPGGERERVLQRAASVLSWLPPGRKAKPADVAEILRPSLSVWAAEPGAKLTIDVEMAKAIDRIRRSQEDYESKQGKALDAVRAFFDEGNTEPPVDAAKEKESLLHRAIIQFRSAYYVYDFNARKYTPPKTKEELPIVISNLWSGDDLPIDLEYIDAQGKTRRKPEVMLLREYGTNVNRVVLDLTQQVSRLDEKSSTFYEAAAPKRALEPRFDTDVDGWLKAFGGAQSEKILDWLACVTRLDEPICALCIEGSPGTGKSLLAAGMSRIYEGKVPTRLSNVIGTSFNEDLIRCPVIHADEGLPKGVKGLTEALRELIAGFTQTINRKHLPSVSMKGAVRLIVTTNGDNVLAAMGSEDFSLADLDAVAGRFLHLKVPIDRKYLEALLAKNPDVLKSWIRDDLLARHILWLCATRTVVKKGRFLVEGELDDVHKQILTAGGGVRGLVLEWLARFLANPRPLQNQYKGTTSCVLFDEADAQTYINVNAIVDLWTSYMGEKRPAPPFHALSKALGLYTLGDKRSKDLNNRMRYRKIKWDIILSWADEAGIGDIELMQKHASGLPPGEPNLKVVK